MESPDEVKIFFKKVLASWKLMIASVVICLGLAFLLTRYLTPMFKVTAKLLVEDEKKGGGSFNAGELLGDMGGFLNMKSNVDNEVEILKTRAMFEKVVKALSLNITYFQKGTVKNLPLYESPFKVEILKESEKVYGTAFKLSTIDECLVKVEYKDRLTKETISVDSKYGDSFLVKDIGEIKITRNQAVPFEKEEYMFAIYSLDEAIGSLQKAMTIAVTNKLVTTIDLTLNSTLPIQGEKILSKFIQGYIEQNILDKNVVVDSTIAFIENRLNLVGSELGEIEGEIQKFKQSNKLADISEQARLLVNSNVDYIKELSELETQMKIIDNLSKDLHDKTSRVIPSSAVPADLVFNRLIEGYNMLLLEREKLLLSTTETNPYVKNLDARIAEQRESLASNLDATKKGTDISIKQLRKKIAELGDEIKNIPAHERTNLGMFRQQTLKQELYLFLLQKREEIALTKTSNISNSKIIDSPQADLKPHSPNKVIILSIGFILGFLFPFGFVYLRELFNDKVQTKEDIQKESHIPVIGEIGKTVGDDLSIMSPKSILSEQFRALRTNLNFYIKSRDKAVFLITSSTKGEGKTFTATNLGIILALSDKKVLLVDLDLRMASLSRQLKMSDKKGFTNYIISTDPDYKQYIYPSELNEKLFIFPAGILPPNPAEMLMNTRTESFFAQIKDDFDYLVVDSPPVGLVADSLILAKFASITLYIVRQGHTFKEDLKTLNDLKTNKMVENIAVIFNDIKVIAGKAYGYGKYGK